MTIGGALQRETIYEAAYDDEAFAALPDLIRQACDARSTVIHFLGADGDHASMAHTGHWNDAEIALYGEYSDRDLLLQATSQTNRVNRFWNITEDFVSQNRLRGSAIYHGFYSAIGDDTRHVLGATFDTPWGLGAIGIHRGEHTSAFGDAQLQGMQALALDLRRMLVIRSKLWTAHTQQRASRAALDGLTLAILQTDRSGKILTANAAAETLLRTPGSSLRGRGGKIAADGLVATRLAEALWRATDPEAPQASLVRLGDGPHDLTLTVSPLPGAAPSRALLVVKPAETTSLIADRLRTYLGLTPAEADIAASLWRGHSPGEIAATRGASEQTVRSQIKALLAKTGCRRQVELLALIGGLPPTR